MYAFLLCENAQLASQSIWKTCRTTHQIEFLILNVAYSENTGNLINQVWSQTCIAYMFIFYLSNISLIVFNIKIDYNHPFRYLSQTFQLDPQCCETTTQSSAFEWDQHVKISRKGRVSTLVCLINCMTHHSTSGGFKWITKTQSWANFGTWDLLCRERKIFIS